MSSTGYIEFPFLSPHTGSGAEYPNSRGEKSRLLRCLEAYPVANSRLKALALLKSQTQSHLKLPRVRSRAVDSPSAALRQPVTPVKY